MKQRRGYQYIKPIRFRKSSGDHHPVDEIGYFGFTWFTWMTPVIKSIWSGKTENNIPYISQYESVRHCYEHINACLALKKSFGGALWRSVRGLFIMYFLSYMMWALALLFNSTIMVALIISFVRVSQVYQREISEDLIESNETFADVRHGVFTYSSPPTMSTGLLIVGGLFFIELVRCNLYSSVFAIVYRMGQRLRAAMNGLVVNKCLRLRGGKGAKSGEILNIVSADGDRLVDGCRTIASAIVPFFVFVICLVIGCFVIGWPSLIGNGIILLSIPVFMLFGKLMVKYRERGSEYSGTRIELLSEILSSIRLIKMFSWEGSFSDRVNEARHDEALAYFKMNTSVTVLFGVNTIISCFAIVATFSTMNLLNMELPESERVFIMISVWNTAAALLRFVPLGLSSLANLKAAVERTTRFLDSEEIEVYVQVSGNDDKHVAELVNASLSWNQEDESCLKDINLSVPRGKVVALTGSVGSGKSSILGALTNQMILKSGQVRMTNNTAYAPQEPWLMGGTVQENILFGKDFDASWYKEVTFATGLLPDFQQFDDGDQTHVGQEGIALSGGQRARIGLARAVYRRPDLILLDDPLSAVDRHVAKHIWTEAVGKLLRDSAVIITTHQLIFIRDVDMIYNIKDGRVLETGSPGLLLNEETEIGQSYIRFIGPKPKLLKNYSYAKEDLGHTPMSQKMLKKNSARIIKVTDGVETEDAGLLEDKKQASDEMIEVRPTASSSTYSHMIMKGSGLPLFGIVILMHFIIMGVVQGTTYWVGLWLSFLRGEGITVHMAEDSIWRDNSFYLKGFFAAAVIVVLGTILKSIYYSLMVKRIVDNLVMTLVDKLLRTKQRFFDVTPKGTIMARLSKDQEEAETYIPMLVDNLLVSAIMLVFITIFVSLSIPYFLISVTVVLIPTLFLTKVSWKAIDFLKRRDLLSRSPWYNHTISIITGLPVIRVFNRELDMVNQFYECHDTNSTYYYLFFSACRWYTTRCDMLSTLLTCSTALFLVIFASQPDSTITSDMAGSVLALTLQISALYQMTFRCSVETHSRMSSIASMLQYTKSLPLESTDKPINPKSDNIFTNAIVFKGVSMRYRSDLTTVIKNLNIQVGKGEHIGVVGRTGSGKSSLFTALFHLSDAMEGEVLINGRSIKNATLSELRRSMALIPQDPTLFSGSIRFNLDPEKDNTDDECIQALKTCGLAHRIEKLGGLEGQIDRGGSNLSVGERQLFCMARAILRKSNILLLDEATAAVDGDNDANIQQVLRTEFKSTTVMTIAHRLNTIADYNRILVMDNGIVAEFDTPKKLLENSHGQYYSMVNA